jgi:hypothetical protein
MEGSGTLSSIASKSHCRFAADVGPIFKLLRILLPLSLMVVLLG